MLHAVGRGVEKDAQLTFQSKWNRIAFKTKFALFHALLDIYGGTLRLLHCKILQACNNHKCVATTPERTIAPGLRDNTTGGKTTGISSKDRRLEIESVRGTIRGRKVKTFGMDFHLVPKRPQGNPAGRRRTEEGGLYNFTQAGTGEGGSWRNKSQAEEARPLQAAHPKL